MCDAILFCLHQNKTYLFVIELKTGHKGDCKKQLINGKLFCNWLIALYIQHKNLNPEVTTVPVLIWKPRQNPPRKGTTTHSGYGIKKEPFIQLNNEPGLEIRNCDNVSISKLASILEGTA